MAKLKLTYFDFDGGRGEPARLALHIGGIAFEDHRIAGKEWPAFRDKTPFLAMPTLEVDGQVFSQSNSINRYVGKLTGLYPNDDLQAFRCDEVMEAVEDISTRIGQTIGLPEDAKKKAREELAAGLITRFLEQFQTKLKAAGGEYFADRHLTVADLKVAMLIRWLRSGVLDYIPKDLVDTVAPQLVKHFERVTGHPKVAEYYQRRKAA
ncbi:MAG: glutathione S-transferase family protein [Burkholderiales bacterium]|jgi:glutathione S-transferase|nr:glutathione S-transferase family protein [Burkholderiales bacterium]